MTLCSIIFDIRVRLIGSEDQDAVLVTGGQTFKLTKAETSNTLLLLPPEGTSAGTGSGARRGAGFEAVAAVGYQYEVKCFVVSCFVLFWSPHDDFTTS